MNPLYTRVKRYYSTLRKDYPRASVAVLLLAGSGLLGLAIVLIFLFAVSSGVFGELPSRADLASIKNATASEIYAADGQLMGRYFRENRTHCPLAEMPDYLPKALVAVEDSRFYEHAGIDYQAWGRVAFKTILLGRDDQGGGSTLSQQLIKNTFPRKQLGYGSTIDLGINKIKEAITARRLEKIYSKDEIIELYLNTVAFSDNTFGVEAAARRYWQKAPKELSVEECAALVAMLKATSSYCPLRSPKANKQRRQLIMALMEDQGYLKEVNDTSEFKLNYFRPDGYEGPVPHFRETVRKEVATLLKGTDRGDGRPYNLQTDGLKVHTTLNLSLQRIAEAAVREQLEDLQQKFDRHLRPGEEPWTKNVVLYDALRNDANFQRTLANGADTIEAIKALDVRRTITVNNLYGEPTTFEGSTLDSLRHVLGTLRAGFLVVDHSTSKVVAWVGGGNPYFSAYDNVTGRHQTGSSFKPIVYAAALDAGVDPCRRYDNELISYARYDGWEPKNSNGEYGGSYSLHGGLQRSVNTVAVQLIMDIGPERVSRLAAEVGLPDVLPVPSTALGTHEASLLQMVGAYTPFVNGGEYSAPRYIDKITNAQGEVIYASTGERSRVMSYESALTTLDMLRGVVDGGTGWRLRTLHGLKGQLAGKTGTTQDAGDGWFVGLTPKLIGGAWVGGVSPAVRFRRGSHGNGGRAALPIWGSFLERISEDPSLAHYVEGNFPSIYKSGFPCSAYEEADAWDMIPEHNFEEVPSEATTEAR